MKIIKQLVLHLPQFVFGFMRKKSFWIIINNRVLILLLLFTFQEERDDDSLDDVPSKFEATVPITFHPPPPPPRGPSTR